MNKSQHIIDGYAIKKQIHSGYKIVEFSHYECNGKPITNSTKRTIHKNLLMTDAEEILYRLESKL